MKIFLALSLLFVFSILPSMATDWIPNNSMNLFYDRDSTKVDEFGVYSVNVKQLPRDDKEVIATLLINCKTKRFSHSESVIYDIKKQKNVSRHFLEPNWDAIPKDSNIDFIYCQVCH